MVFYSCFDEQAKAQDGILKENKKLTSKNESDQKFNNWFNKIR